MPNWKTYESSVRLLSAILAAHPELKLNYDEVGKKYGGGTTYKSVWARMSQMKSNAELINNAFEAGIDPITVDLPEAPAQAAKRGSVLSQKMGSDCTVSAIENRFRRIRQDAKRINDAISNGVDPSTLGIGGDGGPSSEIQQHFGSDATANGIRFQFATRIKGDVKLLKQARADGQDCKDVVLSSDTKGKGVAKTMGSDVTAKAIQHQIPRLKAIDKLQLDALDSGSDPKDVDLSAMTGNKSDISKYFGQDSTSGGIGFQFRQLKQYAKSQKACANSGGDPQTLGIGAGKGEDGSVKGGQSIASYYPDGSKDSLQHRFRPIVAEAQRLRNGGSVAGSFGQGITGKAVSERFLRMKKEEAWNLDINRDVGTTPKSSKKSTTPKGKKFAGMDDNVDDEESFTPSKKGKMDKVIGGRVAKGKNANKVVVNLEDDFVKGEFEQKLEDPFDGAENDYGFGGFSSKSFNAPAYEDAADEA